MDPNWTLLAIAIANCFTAYFAFRTHSSIGTLEKNTNSIKDALVASTAKASYAEGSDHARIAGEQKAADLLRENNE